MLKSPSIQHLESDGPTNIQKTIKALQKPLERGKGGTLTRIFPIIDGTLGNERHYPRNEPKIGIMMDIMK